MTMRPTRQTPTLRMADGGNVITRWANRIMQPTHSRLRQIDAPEPVAAPSIAPAPAPAAPVDPNNPAGIRFADGGSGRVYKKGSRDGGRVVGPGDGTVDTVDAEYANGEHVIPADTAEAIGHDTLDALIAATHTPVAEQRAMKRGQGLRLADGGYPGISVKERLMTAADERLFNPRPSIPGIDVTERSMTPADKSAFIRDPGPGNPNVGPNGSAEARSLRAPPVAPAGLPATVPSAPAAPTGSAAYDAAKRVGGNLAAGASRVLANPMVQGGMRVLGAAAAIPKGLNAVTDAQNGDFAGAANNGLRAGAATASTMPGMVGAAGTALGAGLVAGDQLYNRLSTGVQDAIGGTINQGLRGFGLGGVNDDAKLQLDAEARGPTPRPAGSTAAVPAIATVSEPNPQAAASAPAGMTLRGQTGAEVAGAPGVAKFTQGGKTLYSNVAGEDNTRLMANNPGVSTVPGMSRGQIDEALGGQSAGQVTADNAIRAANLRDGVDINRGTSQEQAGAGNARLQALANSPIGTAGRGFARQQLRDQATNAVTIRGQDIAARGQDITARGQDMTARTAAIAARADQAQKDRSYQLDVEKFGEDKAKTMMAQREQADKDLTGKLESMFTTQDAKGNTVTDKAKVASHKAAVTSYIGSTIDKLERVAPTSPDYAQSQKIASELRARGAAALGEDRLQKLITQLEVKERSEGAASTFNPFGGKHIDSSDPSAYDVVGKDKGLFQDQYRLRNGSSVPARTLDYDKGGNAILPNGIDNRRTTRFDTVKKGLRNE